MRHVVCRNFGFTFNYVQTRDLNGSPTAIGNDRATDVGGPSFLPSLLLPLPLSLSLRVDNLMYTHQILLYAKYITAIGQENI